MKKNLPLFLLFWTAICTVVIGQSQEKQEDMWKDFYVVTKSETVSEETGVGFNSIDENDILSYLKFLSSDLLEGRETATKYFDIAADYVSAMFSLWHLMPAGDMSPGLEQKPFPWSASKEKGERTYFQEIEMKEVLTSKGQMKVRWIDGSQEKTAIFSPDIDYTYFSKDTHSLTGAVVFVGYGISEENLKYDEYNNLDVRGKIVMMFTEVPRRDDPKMPWNQGDLKEKYNPQRIRHRMILPKIKVAREKGALAVLLIENSPGEKGDIAKKILDSQKVDDAKPIFPIERRRLSLIQKSEPLPWEALPYIRISGEMADVILGFSNLSLKKAKATMENDLKPQSRELKGVSITLENCAETRLVRSRNVLGYIEGADPVLKNQVVVIGAHLDHLGRKGDYIFNGADDNGSGSVAVMEIAEAFSKNPVKPKRSVLFALWTGEEEGFLGSRYYVENPFFPLEKTVACLNLDMVSREWTLENLKMINEMWKLGIPGEILEKIDLKNFITLSMDINAPTLYDAIKASNRYLGLTIYPRKSSNRDWGSDHASFAQKNIPWFFCFAATTQDYHQPSDSMEKVSASLIQKYSRLVYLSAFNLANK